MIQRSGESGMAAIESLVALSFLIIALPMGLMIMYFSLARVWIDRSSYEALVCLATSATENKCRNDFRSALDRVLKIGRLKSLHLQRRAFAAQIDVRFEINSAVGIHHRDSIRLPLQPESPL